MDRDSFERDGYTVAKNFFKDGELDALQRDVEELGRHIVGSTFDFNNAETISAEHQSIIYDRLHYLPALYRLAGSQEVRDLCRSLGLEIPWLMGSDNMRLDRPHATKHLFDWHQDTLYLLGSTNAVTLWIPLSKVDLHFGTIQVAPGSHKRGLHPFKKISDKIVAPYTPMLQRDLSLDFDIPEEPVTIEAERGDAVIFKQMLLHRSTGNHSDRIRWTVQLRLTDLGETAHRDQNYPTGDKTNVYYVDYPGFRPERPTT